MTVSLKLYRKSDGQSQLLRERSFEGARITIGRGTECAMPLEDPKKWVSRVHAEVQAEGDALWLVVVSKVNPVFVNGERRGPGDRSLLNEGDRFEIGDYEIELVPQPKAPPPPPPAEPTFIGQPAYQPDIVLDADPAPSQPDTVPIAAVFAEATFMGQKLEEPKQEESVEDSVFREVTLLRNLPPPEEGFLDAGKEKDEEEEARLAVIAAKIKKAGPPPQEEAPPAPPPKAEVPPEEQSVFLEQTFLRSKSPDVTLPNPGDMQAPAGQALEHALHAFLEGAGLQARQFSSPQEMELFLRQCGAIVRASVEGVMALLVARAEAKKEFRAEDRTMVASRDNNPLKLMADPQEAIDFLFDTNERSGGFLTPVQAVGDAFEDMRAHEAALIAGMRAAILGSLKRFDPKTLEEELSKSAGGLGLNKKAKLWDLFSSYQQKLARDAEEDFNKVFGRDFMAAYMEQVRKLKKK
jgi:type VI secretion system FHA domain protein